VIGVVDSYLPVVSLLAQLLLEVSQGEAVRLHHAAVRNLLPAEEVGDHQLLRPGKHQQQQQGF